MCVVYIDGNLDKRGLDNRRGMSFCTAATRRAGIRRNEVDPRNVPEVRYIRRLILPSRSSLVVVVPLEIFN